MIKKIKKFCIFIFFSSVLLFAQTEQVKILNNRDYFPVVSQLINNATKSIYLVMYEINYYEDYSESPTNQLINSLIKASQRGVKVEVILEQSKGKFYENITKENLSVGIYLANNGVKVYMDSLDTTTHAKLLIVDSKYVVLGSTNWSYYSFEKNNETNVLIESEELAKNFFVYFQKLKDISISSLTPKQSKKKH